MRVMLKALFLLLIAFPIAAQELGEIDPVSVSPDKFTVILENEHVRVVEYTLKPGERDDWHTHPEKLSYVVDSGTLRITTAEGKSFLVEENAGSASWMNSLSRHYAENVGKTSVKILLVEVKESK